ncbi:MAG: NAD-dependent epimerase/dehydratase family protein, partial [Bacteroidetes bacterium]|nr:NAD-dependent epimerase/dehydratase family protein [Bacteroidota bacterium]
CRTKSKLPLLEHNNIKVFEGNLLDIEAVREAMRGCSQVFHLATYFGVQNKDMNQFNQINVGGTQLILDVAIEQEIKKIVITSTAAIFGSSTNGTVDEKCENKMEPFTFYEKSKAYADKIALSYVNKGIEVVVVNPTRIYGPGLKGESNSVSKMIELYIRGKWKLLPGNGMKIGNYVFIDDVVQGHLLAMEKGISGNNYILGGENVNYIELFNTIHAVAEVDFKLTKVPLWIMIIVAHQQKLFADLFGIKPLITPPWIKKYLHDWTFSTEKSENELGYSPISLHEGLSKTIKWLRNSG